jgi:hypothetical protein
MITTILSHEVKNYSTWKKVFDEDNESRKKFGLNIIGVYTSLKNPKKVTLICELPSVESVKSFFAMPGLKKLMQRGGIIGIPEIKILNQVKG